MKPILLDIPGAGIAKIFIYEKEPFLNIYPNVGQCIQISGKDNLLKLRKALQEIEVTK